MKEDRANLERFLGNVSQQCSDNIKVYLTEGSNNSFTTGEAQLSLQKSGACDNSQITLMSEARKLDKQVQIDTTNLSKLEISVPGLRNDAKNNYELIQGPVSSAVSEIVAAMILYAAS